MKYKTNVSLFLEKHRKTAYYIVPFLVILILSFVSNFFSIDKKVINSGQLLDMAGRPYETFLYEMNLPNTVGAVFVGGTPDNLVKIDETYKKINTGDIFTAQLRSFLSGTKITEYSIASYINFIFGISAIIFSLLSGYLIFRNGYVSIGIFILIVLFRNFAQGLIYGLPLRHEYAVFNPLLAFCIIIFIIMFFKKYTKKYWLFFVLSGFTIAYITHIRPSEGQIVISSLFLFTAIIFLEYFWGRKENYIKLLTNISIMLVAIYAGYFGYQKMVAAFEYHRDVKLNLPASEKILISRHPPFHTLYTSLFRYDVPNKFGDKIGYDAFYEKYPEIKKKYRDDFDYVKLANSDEYNTAMRELYFEFIVNNPKHFLYYLSRSIYDYFLFLPYYSWTGNKSAHAYLPKINDNVEIEPHDLALFFANFNLILNLKMKYLPQNLLFWIYFISAYVILIEALYTSFAVFKKTNNKDTLANEIIENNLPIYLLWGMLIYFFFASVVRILIPVHGQGAVVAFNVIISYNMVRLVVTMRNVEVKTKIIQVWTLLLFVLLLFSVAKKIDLLQMLGKNIFVKSSISAIDKVKFNILKGVSDVISPNIVANGGFRKGTNGWIAYQSSLSVAPEGLSGNCLQITASENGTGYAYIALPTKVGEMYKFKGYFKKGSASDGQIKVGTTVDDTSLYYSGVLSDIKWRKLKGTFRATSPTTYITLVNLTSVKGQASFFDGISLTEVKCYADISTGKKP